MSLQILVLTGIPGAGKSTWAKAHVAKDPLNWVRVNNDLIREMINNSIYSVSSEAVVRRIRQSVIAAALSKNKNVVVDNLNLKTHNFEEAVEIAKSSNKDVTVSQKIFYVDLETAILRDSSRTGSACVGRDIILKWWRESGKESLQNKKPKIELVLAQKSATWTPLKQDTSLPKAVVFDNDGTISLLNGRNPYDASTCDKDLPHEHVIEVLNLYYRAGYKIIFVSGRQEKYREPTEKFYAKYIPNVPYELYMRPNDNTEKDVIIKEEIFNNHIKNRYYIAGWFDDRLQICTWLYRIGIPLFRVGDPEASF